MRRIEVLVEGETEQGFVEDVLQPHFIRQDVNIWAILSGKQVKRTGGIKPWRIAKEDILRSIRNKSCHTTTLMVDFYGMPEDWPGRAAAGKLTGEAKVRLVETEVLQAIQADMPGGMAPHAFIPYVQLHEFEALLFAGAPILAAKLSGLNPGGDRELLEKKIMQIAASVENPELINDNPSTSPSHRIRDLVAVYRKPLIGKTVTSETGLQVLRHRCPHFDGWLKSLEALPHVFEMMTPPL